MGTGPEREPKRQKTLFDFPLLFRPPGRLSTGSVKNENDGHDKTVPTTPVRSENSLVASDSTGGDQAGSADRDADVIYTDCGRSQDESKMRARSMISPKLTGKGKRGRLVKVKETVVRQDVGVVWKTRFRRLEEQPPDERDGNLDLDEQLDEHLDAEKRQDVGGVEAEDGDEEDDDDGDDVLGNQQTRERTSKKRYFFNSTSMYVQEFEAAASTVLKDEIHLFSSLEVAVLDVWMESSIPARNLFMKMLLRQDGWQSVAALERVHGMDPGEITDVIDELSEVAISARLDSSYTTNRSPGNQDPELDFSTRNRQADQICFLHRSEDTITDLKEATGLLRSDDLRSLARRLKISVKPASQRGQIEQQIWRVAENQTSVQTGSSVSLACGLLKEIVDMKGPCVRLSPASRTLFTRLLMVYYRLTVWSNEPLKTSILVRIGRQSFPRYTVNRVTNLFSSRRQVLEFERALKVKSTIDDLVHRAGTSSSAVAVKTFEDSVEQRWRTDLAAQVASSPTSAVDTYRRRFASVWIYTKVAHQIVGALAKLKRYDREHALLTDLLTQRVFHTGRRGKWYNRRALLEERYMAAVVAKTTPADGSPARERKDDDLTRIWRFQALSTCEQGLQDPLVAPVDHHDLQQRIGRLEKLLRVPVRERHNFTYTKLALPIRENLAGIRVVIGPKDRPAGPECDRAKTGPTMWLDPKLADTIDEDLRAERTGLPDGPIPVCRVEQLCLYRYCAAGGWKGMHSESGVVRALFTLLFYDILFPCSDATGADRTAGRARAPPGVFQSPYQTAPLDLFTPAFYPARQEWIAARLADISAGGAADIVARTWRNHSFSCSSIVGIHWSDWSEEQVIEIASCWPPAALAEVCGIIAKDYRGLGAGVPDLFLWKPPNKVMFVEVKSESDSLHDQRQRFWIDFLSGTGIRVSVCDVVADHVVRLV